MSTTARGAEEGSGRDQPGGRVPPSRTLADRVARRRLAALAGHEGDAVAAATFLTDDDPSVRATALQALARCDALTEPIAGAATRDPAPIVRRRVSELMAGHAGAVSLLPLLADDDAGVAEAAAFAAGERHQDEREIAGGDRLQAVVTQLVSLASGHADPLVREAAVAALGAVGAADGLPAVLEALDDKVTIRRRAVIALAAFAGPEVDAALAGARHDRDWHVRQTAEDLSAD